MCRALNMILVQKRYPNPGESENEKGRANRGGRASDRSFIEQGRLERLHSVWPGLGL